MIAKVLPYLRKIFDFEEVITMLSNLRLLFLFLVVNTTLQLNALYNKAG